MASSLESVVDENENLSIDSVWELKRYAVVLSLLQKDFDFPRNLDLEVLDDQDEIQGKLKVFAQERNLLHEWIKNDKLQQVKEFTLKNKSKYYLNDENHSAAFSALINKKFRIYAFLQSINVHLKENESYMIGNLTLKEKYELQNIMLSYFSTMEKSHIYYLISKMKIKSKNSLEQYTEELFGYLETLNLIPEISIILKVIQQVEDLDLVLDLDKENVQTVCPSASSAERGSTFHWTKTIYVAAGPKRSKNEVLGTLAHELTHMAMQVVFNNDCDPYFKWDSIGQEEFRILTSSLQKNLVRIIGTPSETLTDAFRNYSRSEYQSELIARVPHILAQYAEGKEWLKNNVIEFFDYFNNRVIPECEKLIEQQHLSKQKCLNRHMNESEGEIIAINKCGLFFTNIDKLQIFFNDTGKKVFSLITKCTWLGLLRALQAVYSAEYAESYDDFLVFTFENVVKNLEDVEYLLNNEATKMLFVECPDIIGNNSKFLNRIKKIMKVVKAKKDKKIIFIMKEDENKDFMKILDDQGLSDAFAKENDEDFSLCELECTSRRKILDSIILFQGKEFRLIDLVNNKEDLLKCVNGQIMEAILNKKKIKIGSKPFGMSSLEGAYADVAYEVNLLALIHEIKFSEDIFLICGKKNEFDERLNKVIDASTTTDLKSFEHEVVNDKRIFLTDEDIGDEDFKKFCDFRPEKKIYLIEKSKGSTFMLSKVYNPDFYFKRQMRKFKKITIRKDFHLDLKNVSDTDMFIIGIDSCNTSQYNYDSSNIVLVCSEKMEIEFENLKRSGKPVHVLKGENDKLIWIKSHGSLSGLRKVVDEELSEEIVVDENELTLEVKEKVLILADEPGMGKSTTLTKLYEDKSISDTHWIIRFNLKDHLIPIRNMRENLNIKQVTKFLIDIDSKLGNDFSRKLLEAALDINKQSSKILLLCCDGFDELSDDKDRKKIINLLKFLKDNAECKIWVTSRLHFKETLENELSVISMKFNPIDDPSKMDFIKNYMKVRSKLTLPKERFDEAFEFNENIQEGSTLWTYAKAFIAQAKSIFKENVETFIGTPLTLHLLLENSAVSFRNWIENIENLNHPDFSYLGNNLIDVYEKYFDRKYEIYFKKKNFLEEEPKYIMKDTFEKYHEEIAYSLVKNENSENEIAKCKFSFLLLGITRAEGDRIEFVHFTFREYFFARSLIKKFINHNSLISWEDLYTFFIEEILVEEKYQLIRNFINEYLKNFEIKKSLTMHEHGLRTIIISTMGNTDVFRTPFHSAVEELNSDLLDFLFGLKFSKSEFCTIFLRELHDDNWLKHNFKKGFSIDDFFRGIPVFHLAVKQGNDFALNKLLETATKYNLDLHLLSRADKAGKTPLHWAVERKNDLALNKLLETSSKYNLDQQLLSGADKSAMTPFHLAVQRGNDFALIKLLEIASKYNLDRQLLSRAANNGMTALHLAIERKNDLALNKLLEIASKYNLDQQLLSRADTAGTTLLHLAIETKNDFAFNKLLEIVSKYNLEQQLLSGFDEAAMISFLLAIERGNDFALTKLIEIASKYNLDRQLLSSTDNKRMTLLHWAVLKKNDFSFNKLVEIASKYNLDQQILSIDDRGGKTLLHLALETRNNFAFNKLFEIASRYNLGQQLLSSADSEGMTLLHLAVEWGDDLAFNKLVEIASKYNLEQQLLSGADNKGMILLHWAVLGKNDLIFNKLLEVASKYKFDEKLLSIADNKGNTPFLLAVQWGYDFAFSKLLEIASKYNLDQTLLSSADNEGKTAFHLAVQWVNDFAFNKLLEIASKYNLGGQLLSNADKEGMTPLHLAVQLKIDFVFNILLEIASNYNLGGQLLSSANEGGMTPLHLAVELKNDFAFNVLLEVALRYNLDQQLLSGVDKLGMTPLHSAVERKNDLALNKLLEIASKYNLDQQLLFFVNKEGRSLLHAAVISENELALGKAIKMASNYGLDQQHDLLSIVNVDGNTVLHVAVGEAKSHYALDQLTEMASKFISHKTYELLRITNKDNETVLHLAAKKEENHCFDRILKMVSTLSLNQQFNLLNIQNKAGETVSQVAVGLKNNYAVNRITKMVSESAFSLEQRSTLLKAFNRSSKKARSTRKNGKRNKCKIL